MEGALGRPLPRPAFHMCAHLMERQACRVPRALLSFKGVGLVAEQSLPRHVRAHLVERQAGRRAPDAPCPVVQRGLSNVEGVIGLVARGAAIASPCVCTPVGAIRRTVACQPRRAVPCSAPNLNLEGVGRLVARGAVVDALHDEGVVGLGPADGRLCGRPVSFKAQREK